MVKKAADGLRPSAALLFCLSIFGWNIRLPAVFQAPEPVPYVDRLNQIILTVIIVLVHSKHKQTIPTGMDRLCLFNYNKRAMDDVWRLGLRIRKEKQSAILLL